MDHAAAKALAKRMTDEVAELAAKDWGAWHLYSVPVNQYNNRFTYFNCPDELLTALAMAMPHLDTRGRADATAAADREFDRYFPVDHPYKNLKTGDERRGWHDLPEDVIEKASGSGGWQGDAARSFIAFKTMYGIWAYADAFDRWDRVEKAWPKIKQARNTLGDWDWMPKWNEKRKPGVLTSQTAESDRYRHELKRYLLTGTHGFYHNNPPRDEHTLNMHAQYAYTKLLSALIGYGRIADHLGDEAESKWARQRFDHVAKLMLTMETGPYYWSSPWLTPEVGRLIHDHAGPYLDEAKNLSNIATFTEVDGMPTPGPHHRVIDPHHWWVTQAGSNGAVPPCSPMSGFLSQAYLFQAPAEQLDDWTDIPWCQADYWYIHKCAVALNTYGQTRWVTLHD